MHLSQMTLRLSRRLPRALNVTHGLCLWKGRLPSLLSYSKYSTRSSSPPQVEYVYIDDVESLYHYYSGGYHPVHIGDRLHNRYRIVHKLGHGSYSTVWLAVDEQTSEYAAIKVATADAERSEGVILSQLSNSRHDGRAFIPAILDCFDIAGPNGTHPCLVTSPARCSLRDSREASGSGLFQLDVARSFAVQLVMAVALIHSQGFAHGDLHLGNLLLQMPSTINTLSLDELYERYGQPQQEPAVRLDTKAPSTDPGVPSYVIPAMDLGIPSNEITLDDSKLLLSDFGVAFRPSDKPRLESFVPFTHRAPESHFEPTKPLAFASDVWSLGCLIFELVGHRSLIDGLWLASQDDMIAQQVQLLGPMPAEWWERWEERCEWYDEAGNLVNEAAGNCTWNRRFENWVQWLRMRKGMETVGDEEREAFIRMLQCILKWKPEERPTAEEVLKAEWVTRWALPSYEKGLKARPSLPHSR